MVTVYLATMVKLLQLGPASPLQPSYPTVLFRQQTLAPLAETDIICPQTPACS